MSTQRNYTKVSGGNDNQRWEPNKSKEAIDTNNPPKIEGYYLDSNERNGKEGPFTVHEIQTVNEDGSLGDFFDVSLGVGLNKALGKVSLGKFVCVKFNGKKHNPKTGRNFNDADVFVDENAIPYNQLSGEIAKGAGIENAVNKATPVSNKTQPNQNKQNNGNKINESTFDQNSLPF